MRERAAEPGPRASRSSPGGARERSVRRVRGVRGEETRVPFSSGLPFLRRLSSALPRRRLRLLLGVFPPREEERRRVAQPLQSLQSGERRRFEELPPRRRRFEALRVQRRLRRGEAAEDDVLRLGRERVGVDLRRGRAVDERRGEPPELPRSVRPDGSLSLAPFSRLRSIGAAKMPEPLPLPSRRTRVDDDEELPESFWTGVPLSKTRRSRCTFRSAANVCVSPSRSSACAPRRTNHVPPPCSSRRGRVRPKRLVARDERRPPPHRGNAQSSGSPRAHASPPSTRKAQRAPEPLPELRAPVPDERRGARRAPRRGCPARGLPDVHSRAPPAASSRSGLVRGASTRSAARRSARSATNPSPTRT